MKKVPCTVEFKTKVKTISDVNSSNPGPYIEFKRRVKRSDCDLTACKHDYFNSDLFEGILNRAYQGAISGKYWIRLSELPSHIVVDTSKFLATVKVSFEC